MKDKSKRYEVLKHEENNLDCLHCKYDKTEKSLVDKIKSMKDTDKTQGLDKDGVTILTKTFQKLVVKRGRHDDVIGWSVFWQ